MQPRPYQDECRRSVYKSLGEVRSTLAVLATGLGKTIIFSTIAKDALEKGKRVLILAHREELVTQAAEKFERVSGKRAAIEMAERSEALDRSMFNGGDYPQVVVASVQSLVRRLSRFAPDHFDLVVVDEAHHAIAETYRKILAHFDCKVLGVTATPDRGDKKGLRQVFEDVAFKLDIRDGINSGWLVPIRQEFVEAKDLDLSRCRTVAGDLNAGDLEAAMTEMKVLEQVAGPTVDRAGSRPTLLFTVTVAHAHALAEVLRGHTKGLVEALDGTTDRDKRREVVEAFKAGQIQYLVNCALFTEGFDAPNTACVSVARPTKSRALYEQIIGRGTRTLDGVLSGLDHVTADVRRSAILTSPKPDLLVLDFVGNSGKHSLVNTLDVLDGDDGSPEKSLAKGILERGETSDVLEALRRARAQIEEMELNRMRAAARKSYQTVQIDPFLAFGVGDRGSDMLGREPTERQREMLNRAGISPGNLDRAQCSRLISELMARREKDLGTYKQVNRLIKSGLQRDIASRLTFSQCSELMNRLVQNKWKAPPDWMPWVQATAERPR